VRRTGKRDGIRTYSTDTDLVDSKRKEIIEKATRVFVNKGYHQTNMRELAAAIDMSIGSIYHYVGSKQDILYLIINMAATRPPGWIEAIRTSLETRKATDVLRQFIQDYYGDVERARNVTLFTYQETKNLDRKSQKTIMDAAGQDVEACAIILRKGIETGEFRIKNVLLMAHNVIVLGHMLAVRGWYLSSICSVEEYITEQTDLILSRISVK
jgi:TetR/AcrR family transcriptional regulator, cholesterol catabolism regulator